MSYLDNIFSKGFQADTNFNIGAFTGNNSSIPQGPGTDYLTDLNSGLSSKSEEVPEQTFAQNFYDTNETNLFGRSLINNAANDINAGNAVKSAAEYGALVQADGSAPNVLGTHTNVNTGVSTPVNPTDPSLGSAGAPTGAPALNAQSAKPQSTKLGNVVQSGTNFSYNRINNGV